mmetsp:Transcript_23728/g.46265  ORF Transcript_23728/g.46265 Transcript_23728/m.46265 type:complete len:125 (-) Transcript_23728:278-652(-)
MNNIVITKNLLWSSLTIVSTSFTLCYLALVQERDGNATALFVSGISALDFTLNFIFINAIWSLKYYTLAIRFMSGNTLLTSPPRRTGVKATPLRIRSSAMDDRNGFVIEEKKNVICHRQRRLEA